MEHCVEFIGAIMMMSDSPGADNRAVLGIFEDLMKPPHTRAFQKAVVQAYVLLGDSCVGGMPMEAICGGCVMDRSVSRNEETQCQFPI